jgi:hypothetical protein
MITKYLQSYAKRNSLNHSITLNITLDDPYTKKHIAFISWMRNSGACLNKTTLTIYSTNSRGLHAVTDIEPDEVILSIPLSLAITIDPIIESPLGQKIIASKILNQYWEPFIFSVILVLKERTKGGFFKPWVEILSKDASDYPAFFTEAEKSWLEGSNTLSISFNFNSSCC